MVVVPRCAPSWKRPDLCLQPLHTHSIRSSVDSFTSTSTLVVDQCGTPLRSSLTGGINVTYHPPWSSFRPFLGGGGGLDLAHAASKIKERDRRLLHFVSVKASKLHFDPPPPKKHMRGLEISGRSLGKSGKHRQKRRRKKHGGGREKM